MLAVVVVAFMRAAELQVEADLAVAAMVVVYQ
jgi:hypothetical protein